MEVVQLDDNDHQERCRTQQLQEQWRCRELTKTNVAQPSNTIHTIYSQKKPKYKQCSPWKKSL